MKNNLLLTAFFLITLLTNSCATHDQAGAILYKQLDDYNIEASIILYSTISSPTEDSVLLYWGDGNFEYILRSNGPDNDMNGIPDGETLDSFFQMNIYTKLHTYAAFGQYTLSLTNPNRSAGILNINYPNSDVIPFHIETQFKLIPLSGNATNQSPVILEPPIIRAFKGLPYIYTPNAYDIDGDSIVYKRTVPLDGNGTPVANYIWPEQVNPGPNNTVNFNMKKGIFYWNSPQISGEYVIAYLVESYRDGELMDQITFDFTIFVEDDPDWIPEIEIENVSINQLIPVNVGDTMRLEITAFDPDVNQEIEITSSSGLYDYFDNPATFEAIINGNTGTAQFEWIVMDEHVRQQPYQVVIKTFDNDSMYSKTSLVVVCYQFEEYITNLRSFEKELDFKIFPNPVTTGVLNLSIANFDVGFIDFNIYNTLGQKLKAGKISAGLTQIDVGDFDAGIYFLQVGNNKSKFVKSFVIE